MTSGRMPWRFWVVTVPFLFLGQFAMVDFAWYIFYDQPSIILTNLGWHLRFGC